MKKENQVKGVKRFYVSPAMDEIQLMAENLMITNSGSTSATIPDMEWIGGGQTGATIQQPGMWEED